MSEVNEETPVKFASKPLCAPITIVLLLASGAALAQAWPAKPVRLIVPFPPGGVNDGVARAMAPALSQTWGQPVVIDNRGGANGNIGAELCAKAAPDGYTICFPTGVIFSLNPFAYAVMPFDTQRDFVPVIHVGSLDGSIVVHPSVPAHSIRELLDLAKAKPGALTWGSLGNGSNAHLYMEWMQAQAGARFTHIPYKGSADQLRAVISGELHVGNNTPGVVLAHVRSGKLRVLGVVTGGKRSTLLPDVPTLREQGYDLSFRNWLGIFLPAGASNELVRKINADVGRLLADAAFVEKYVTSLGVTAGGGTPEEFAAFARADYETGRTLMKIANLKPQ